MLDIKSRCACYVQICACSATKLCLTLCDPKNCGMPGSLSVEFPRQEYWSGLPFPSPDLPNPGI